MFSKSFIFILLCFKYSIGIRKQLCYDDEECFINAVIDKVYPRFVAGVSGVESSDPLHLDSVIADLPNIKYSLSNASLTGLKDCQFVKLNNTRLTDYGIFDYAIECPAITLTSDYELNGVVDLVPVEGKGTVKIIYEDYFISVSGKYQKEKGDEGKLHVKVIEYSVAPVLRGGVTLSEYINLASGKNQVKIIEEITRKPVLNAFMKKFMLNLRDFHQRVSVEDMHYKYVQSK